jgi:uncharacterized protein YrrD
MRQLRKLSDLRGYGLKASDGEIGHLKQIYFNDRSWIVRYLVVRTGNGLLGQDVLIVPSVIQEVDEENGLIDVKLTRARIESCPPVDTKLPVSRHYEQEYYNHYGWEPYWIGDPLQEAAPIFPPLQAAEPPEQPDDPHLRSSDEVDGYHIQAQDGEIGHVKDFILDDQDWTVRYLEIATRHWLPGKKVLISPAWIRKIEWVEQKVMVDLGTEAIKTAPEYDPSEIIGRDYELTLYKHYGKALHPH